MHGTSRADPRTSATYNHDAMIDPSTTVAFIESYSEHTPTENAGLWSELLLQQHAFAGPTQPSKHIRFGATNIYLAPHNGTSAVIWFSFWRHTRRQIMMHPHLKLVNMIFCTKRMKWNPQKLKNSSSSSSSSSSLLSILVVVAIVAVVEVVVAEVVVWGGDGRSSSSRLFAYDNLTIAHD